MGAFLNEASHNYLIHSELFRKNDLQEKKYLKNTRPGPIIYNGRDGPGPSPIGPKNCSPSDFASLVIYLNLSNTMM